MSRKLNISRRLLKCAEMVTPNSKIADIGTDHAYLPIYLALNNKISYAIASDLRIGPLENAISNIKNFNLENIIETRISDGLKNIIENEVDEVVIAGMGGNVIINILEECKWENKLNKEFILQPMKYESNLRRYLSEKGYKIKKESAVTCMGKVYTAMKVVYTGISYDLSPIECYIGLLERSLDDNAVVYIKKQLNDLVNRRKGAIVNNLKEEEIYYSQIIEDLKKLII